MILQLSSLSTWFFEPMLSSNFCSRKALVVNWLDNLMLLGRKES